MEQSPATVTSLRAVVPTVYLPAAIYSVGQGAIAPVVVLSALELGASTGVAAFIGALSGVGMLIGDVPAGAFAARVGDRRAMLWATVLVGVALVGCVVAPSVAVLAVAIAVVGMCNSVWMLARHSYLTEVVPLRLRGRAMSVLGGVQRVGRFLGPFIGAAAMQVWDTDGAYGVYVVAAVGAAVAVACVRDPQPAEPADEPVAPSGSSRTLREHLPVFRTLGVAVMILGAVRAANNVVIPLWGAHIELDATTTSLIFGIAGAVEMLLFYPAGSIMDRFGRRAIALPCLGIMAVALAWMPFTSGFATLLAASILLGIGNGVGSGIVMTLGADAAPAIGRAEFLGGWRLCVDLGFAMGPAVIGGVTAAASLGPAILVMAGLSVAGAGAMARWIPSRRSDGVARTSEPGHTEHLQACKYERSGTPMYTVHSKSIDPRKKRRIRLWALTLGALAVLVAVILPTTPAFADPPAALPASAPEADAKWQPALDYDKDGCYSTPAIGPDGTLNPGLNNSGDLNGNCRDQSDLDNTNAYSRSKCDDSGWCAYLYDLYFEKDQVVPGADAFGHRHDLEHIVVWVKDDQAQYVSTSQHGDYTTDPSDKVAWEGTHPKVVYHKDGGSTHCFRLGGDDEAPENHYGAWQYPDLVGWDNFPSGIRDTLVNADFGSASLAIKDGAFEDNLDKAKPDGIDFDPRA
nr:MFS transporter [Stackebrandtia nassauensis]